MALLLFTGFLIGVACNIPNSFTPVSSAPELELLDELELLLESEGALLELEELLEPLSEEALELPFEAEPLEPLFPPPPPPPLHAVNIETDTAAASTMAMTLSDNLIKNSSPFQVCALSISYLHSFFKCK